LNIRINRSEQIQLSNSSQTKPEKAKPSQTKPEKANTSQTKPTQDM
jgi:hypothetical protein